MQLCLCLWLVIGARVIAVMPRLNEVNTADH